MQKAGSDEIEVRLLGRADVGVLDKVADGVFDEPIDADLAHEFLANPNHHIVVALQGQTVVGMASAIHYVHPDKKAELWINEVGVAPPLQRRRIGARLLQTMFAHAQAIGCRSAWVATETDNVAANGLYRAAGGRREDAALYLFDVDSD